MKVVVDTNVLVSGMLRPHSFPGEITRMVSSGELRLCIDARILDEYEEVLARPKFDFDRAQVDLLMDFVRHCGHVVASAPLVRPLPDADDEPFLEAALAGQASCLVTGDTADYPAQCRAGARVLTPKQFLEFYRKYRANQHD